LVARDFDNLIGKKMNKTKWYRHAVAILALSLSACATVKLTPPTWDVRAPEKEAAEYAPFLKTGSGTISGQAFLTQRGGGVVTAAGQEVLIDPATPTAIEWWHKAGTQFDFRDLMHPSQNFQNARKRVIADASGKFSLGGLPVGRYFVRTILTWDVPYHGIQGGLLGELVEVKEGQTTNLILNHYAPEYADLN
jgi:hypothetical protein